MRGSPLMKMQQGALCLARERERRRKEKEEMRD